MLRTNIQACPRSQVLLFRERALISAGHVAPKIWEPKVREGKIVVMTKGTLSECAWNDEERLSKMNIFSCLYWEPLQMRKLKHREDQK